MKKYYLMEKRSGHVKDAALSPFTDNPHTRVTAEQSIIDFLKVTDEEEKELLKKFEEGNFSYEDNDRVYFVIEGEEKYNSFIKDNRWIETVKKYASLFPGKEMHIIELYRAERDQKISAAENVSKKYWKNTLIL